MGTKETIRIAAIGDLHFGRTTPPGSLQPLFAQIAESADILVICGDITDYGLAEEARSFVKEVGTAIKIPAVAVLGNHDYESNQQCEIAKILTESGIVTLDGDTTEIHGIGFAGIKGFAGGFGRRALGPWGEEIIKKFVHEAVNEALKLESALARLRNERLVAVLHYSPVLATVEGEPCDIYPFMGCSRLEEPLTRFPVSAVFHGHAHHGRPEGRTSNQVPVFNVSMALMRELSPERPYRLVEIGPVTPQPERRTGADRRALEVR